VVIGVLNAGVTRFGNEIVLLLRVAERPVNENSDVVSTAVYDVGTERYIIVDFPKSDPQTNLSDPRLIVRAGQTYLTSISHLRLARSTDGINFKIEDTPTILPGTPYETFGIEDPRITLIDGTYHITYVAVSPLGVTTCLISTEDFISFNRQGVIFCPENKDVVILPEELSGRFYALHRPFSPLFNRHEMWIAESPDLRCWGNHRCLMAPRSNCWDEIKIGAGAVPFRMPGGWLEIYHGADRNNRYSLGAVLLDSREPWKVIARTTEPVLYPQADYECEGFFGNVVFTCGLLCEEGKLRIYYGAADYTICYAELPLYDIIESLNLQ
jgi:predicted GH43/DUF377 family glycosyl hydrolase